MGVSSWHSREYLHDSTNGSMTTHLRGVILIILFMKMFIYKEDVRMNDKTELKETPITNDDNSIKKAVN